MSKILAVVVALLLAGCVAVPQPDLLTLAERFELTALTDDRGDPLATLTRWEQPYRVRLHEVGKPLPVDLPAFLGDLAALTGLPVDLVPLTDESATVTVAYGPREDIRPWAQMVARWQGIRMSERFTCFAMLEPDGSRAWVYIPNDLSDDHVGLCVAQEMAQVLGLYGDMDGRSDTVFASGNGADHLTETDKDLIRLLYSPELHNGMPRDEALAVVNGLAAGRL